MKIAFLCEIPYNQVIPFRQDIEDVVNLYGGKLIYTLKSNGSIRLQESIPSGEVSKYPPVHRGVARLPGSGVKDAQGNGNRRLGLHDHPSGGSVGGPCGNIPQCDSAGERVQECDRRKCDGWRPCDVASDLDRGGSSPRVRLRFLATDSYKPCPKSQAIDESTPGCFLIPLPQPTIPAQPLFEGVIP